MNNTKKLKANRSAGYVLPLVIMIMAILMALVVGAMMSSHGSRIQAVKTKAETEATLAAEAGYENAIFWMSKQTDILGELQNGGGSGDNRRRSTRRLAGLDEGFQGLLRHIQILAWFKVPGSPFTVEGRTDSRLPTVNLEP